MSLIDRQITDLVLRLRAAAKCLPQNNIQYEAADELERLTATLIEARRRIFFRRPESALELIEQALADTEHKHTWIVDPHKVDWMLCTGCNAGLPPSIAATEDKADD